MATIDADKPIVLASDNWAGAAPEILEAIARANEGAAPAYGNDPLTQEAEERIREVFQKECAVYFTTTGTASNGLALATLTPPYGTILCHEASHLQMEEAGGPEFFTGGAKLLPVRGAMGKLTPETVEAALAGMPSAPPHTMPPSVLSFAQATEWGTFYSAREVKALCEVARTAGMRVHMDGARFANAVVASGATPAELTWKAGVDVLSFGLTKDGCLAAEAVIFFDPRMAGDIEYRRKRGGHLWPKMRFVAAQLDACLEDGLWLRLAKHANAMAGRLSEGLAAIDGVELRCPTQVNEVFVTFPSGVAEALREQGALFHPWVTPDDPTGGQTSRLITSFRTTEEDVARFLARVREQVQRSRPSRPRAPSGHATAG